MSAPHPRGRFVTLEGLEGVGKTTNLAHVESRLRATGRDVVVTREPGGTPFGERLRALVLAADAELRAETELLLMAASRVEHVARVVEPALARGAWVLSDRFLDASVAYQGGGRGLGPALVADLHARLGVTLVPDLTILLDLPVAAGLARMRARGTPDRIEREGVAFFERARAAYLERAAAEPGRVVVVDASAALPDVRAAIDRALAERLGLDPARAGADAGGVPSTR